MSVHPGQFEGRVVSATQAAPGVRVLRVEIPGAEKLVFEAGQYVFLEAEGCAPRAFSVASSPDDPLLEFHVRDSGHGFSALDLKPGSAVTVKGPFGANVWRENTGALLALAGGVGIAPLKSIIEKHLAAVPGSPLYLYWGVREKAQLYLHAHFLGLAAKHAAFHYTPVISGETDENFRAGLAAQAADADFADLAGFSVYMAGPKEMVEAAIPLLLRKNVDPAHIFSDAFSS